MKRVSKRLLAVMLSAITAVSAFSVMSASAVEADSQAAAATEASETVGATDPTEPEATVPATAPLTVGKVTGLKKTSTASLLKKWGSQNRCVKP